MTTKVNRYKRESLFGDSGVFLLIDKEGEYETQMEFLLLPWNVDRDTNRENWVVYRWEPEKCTWSHDIPCSYNLDYHNACDHCTPIDDSDDNSHPVYVLSDNKFHARYPVWFAKDLHKVAKSLGCDIEKLRGGLCSDDIYERAWAYWNLAMYHGTHEFDSYPLELSKVEVKELYGEEWTEE